MFRKIVVCCISFILLGCSSSVQVDDIALQDMKEEILQLEHMGMSYEMEIEYLDESLGLDVSLLSEYVLIYGSSLSATRIVLFEVKEREDIEKFVRIANELRQELIRIFKDYSPNAVEIAEASRIEVRGNYVLFIADSKEEEIWEIVDRYIPVEASENVTEK